MNTQMHQEAFPGEDISDRPPPEESVPGLLALIEGDLPSGRYGDARRAGSARERPLAFELPERLEAHAPPEARGLARDDVRMLVARGDGRLAHARARDLPDFLEPGDLVVVNTSATLPAALPAARRRHRARAAPLDAAARRRRRPLGRRAARDGEPFRGGARRRRASRLPGGARATLSRPTSRARACGSRDLRAARAAAGLPRRATGAPIRYRYVPDALAARGLPDRLRDRARQRRDAERRAPRSRRAVLTALAARGVAVAPIVLHTGVSSLERGERPYPERFRVPRDRAARRGHARRGGRVIAVGTTVVRALETVARADGGRRRGRGLDARSSSRPSAACAIVDGLLTGWHEPEASHLDMLEAVAGRALVERSYAAALRRGYLWHEFGDVHLILP